MGADARNKMVCWILHARTSTVCKIQQTNTHNNLSVFYFKMLGIYYKSLRLNTRTASNMGKIAQTSSTSTANKMPQSVPRNSRNNAPV